MSERLNTAKGSLPNSKGALREHFKRVQKGLPEERRREAREALWDYLEPHLEKFQKVLSFASMRDEVDLSKVNEALQEEGKLHLPKIEGDHLVGYRVRNLKGDTYMMKHNIIQPDPGVCTREDFFDCILVPAVAFDEEMNRLGYGFGFYDRLLARHLNIHTIGIGFREQLSFSILPKEKHDLPVRELCLV